MAVNSVNGSTNSAPVGSGTLDRVKTDGKTIYKDDRYNYEITKDSLVVTDRTTGESFTANGDPHFHTSDGDRGQFQKDNLTLELPNGTKVTIKPTPVNGGVAYIDSVAIMNGGRGVEITGVHSDNINLGSVKRNANELDNKYADGTVLVANGSIDDFAFANGAAFVGGDANARFGELELDGRGGTGRIDTSDVSNIVFEGAANAFLDSGIKSRFITGDGKSEEFDMIWNSGSAYEKALKLLSDPNTSAAGQVMMQQINSVREALSNAFKSMGDVERTIAGNLR